MHFTRKMSSAICFNLDQSKFLSSGNGLDHHSSLETGDNAEGNRRNSFASLETGDDAKGNHYGLTSFLLKTGTAPPFYMVDLCQFESLFGMKSCAD